MNRKPSNRLSRRPEFGLLRGRAVFLSASVPSIERSELYRRVGDAQVEIEDAVVSLARAVFAEGGQLIFGGHPSISPLVAMVAGEYIQPHGAEGDSERQAPVIIHQLDVYRPSITDATALMEQLGQAHVVWHKTDAFENDLVRPSSLPPFPESMDRMRVEMLQDSHIGAMVCIGGMEGVEREAELFMSHAEGRPLFLIASTGGAASLLAERTVNQVGVRVMDREIFGEIKPQLRNSQGEQVDAPLRYVPYPLIMQRIVHELSQ